MLYLVYCKWVLLRCTFFSSLEFNSLAALTLRAVLPVTSWLLLGVPQSISTVSSPGISSLYTSIVQNNVSLANAALPPHARLQTPSFSFPTLPYSFTLLHSRSSIPFAFSPLAYNFPMECRRSSCQKCSTFSIFFHSFLSVLLVSRNPSSTLLHLSSITG